MARFEIGQHVIEKATGREIEVACATPRQKHIVLIIDGVYVSRPEADYDAKDETNAEIAKRVCRENHWYSGAADVIKAALDEVRPGC